MKIQKLILNDPAREQAFKLFLAEMAEKDHLTVADICCEAIINAADSYAHKEYTVVNEFDIQMIDNDISKFSSDLRHHIEDIGELYDVYYISKPIHTLFAVASVDSKGVDPNAPGPEPGQKFGISQIEKLFTIAAAERIKDSRYTKIVEMLTNMLDKNNIPPKANENHNLAKAEPTIEQ